MNTITIRVRESASDNKARVLGHKVTEMSATDAEINAAITLLRAEGFTVGKPAEDPWESPAALFQRLYLSPSTGHKRLGMPQCPPFSSRPAPARGPGRPGGRRIRLRANPALIVFLTQPLTPGKMLVTCP